jgi:hypothetical protein
MASSPLVAIGDKVAYPIPVSFPTLGLDVRPNITPKFRTIVIFRSFFKQNTDSNETDRYAHDL